MGKRDTKNLINSGKAQSTEDRTSYDVNLADSLARDATLGETALGSRANFSNAIGSLKAPSVSAGNVSTGGLSDIQGQYANLGPGFDPARESRVMGDLGQLRNNSVYSGLMSDGGYSAADRANISASALAPISSFARGTRDEWERKRAVSGGYAPGMDAANRLLSRDTSRALADAGMNSRLSVMDRVNQGKLAGAQGMSGNVATAANLDTQIQNLTNQYRLAGLNGQAAMARAIADVEGMNVSNRLGADTFNASSQLGVQQLGMSGLGNLASSDIARQEAERERYLQMMGMRTSSGMGYLNAISGPSQQPSPWAQFGQMGIGALGAIAAF